MESERLKLTPPSMDYIDAMYDVIQNSRAEFDEFLPWVSDFFTNADLESNIKQAIKNYQAFNDDFWFNIVEKETDTFIGAIGFIVRDSSVPFFEIGYWLRTSKTGRGYVTEAVAMIERFAFEDKDAKRIEIKMAGSNIKSQLVAKRCGYVLDAELRNARRLPNGELDSTMIYSKSEP